MKIAAIQAAPVYLDRQATLHKVLALMREAAAKGAELCAFPETFLSGYPVWPNLPGGAQFNDEGRKAAYAAYLQSAIDPGGPEMAAVIAQAEKLGIFTYLGLVERSPSGGSVFCTLAAIHPEKGLLSLHRKLMPTDAERTIWSQGDGHGLRVHSYKEFTVGGLNCWENWMPLARYSLYAQGEQLHIATWPGAPFLTRDITRFIALEGRVFVVSVGGILNAADIPDTFPLKRDLLEMNDRYLSGGTAIAGPDGTFIVEPIKDEETIAYADLDLKQVQQERQNFDPAGHYSRSDVFKLEVDRRRIDPFNEA